MNISNLIITAVVASLGLVKEQLARTFSKDTSVVDREVIDIVLSNPDNKKMLLERLHNNSNSSVEIKIEGGKFSFVD